MVERAVGWQALDAAVLRWAACGGSPELGCALDPATMRSATLELSRRVDAGLEARPTEPQTASNYELPPAAQTGPEPAPRMPAERDAARHGGGTDGYRCQCAGCVAARHQATIDKAFAPAGYVSALHGVPADPALNMVRWPLDELDWLERRADYLSNQINEFNRRLRTLLRRVRG